MIFKLSLAGGLAFVLAASGILAFEAGFTGVSSPGDLAILLFLMSPGLLWASGAWVLRGDRRSSIGWLIVSIPLALTALFGLHLDARMTREEAITHQQTTHLAGFLAILLQWAVGLSLLATLALIRLLRKP